MKLSHDDRGRGVVKFRAEDPESYWIDIEGRLVRRNRKHLRPIPLEEDNTAQWTKHQSYMETSRDDTEPTEREKGNSRGRILKKTRDSQHMYYIEAREADGNRRRDEERARERVGREVRTSDKKEMENI